MLLPFASPSVWTVWLCYRRLHCRGRPRCLGCRRLSRPARVAVLGVDGRIAISVAFLFAVEAAPRPATATPPFHGTHGARPRPARPKRPGGLFSCAAFTYIFCKSHIKKNYYSNLNRRKGRASAACEVVAAAGKDGDEHERALAGIPQGTISDDSEGRPACNPGTAGKCRIVREGGDALCLAYFSFCRICFMSTRRQDNNYELMTGRTSEISL
jgi:hypothetical protein